MLFSLKKIIGMLIMPLPLLCWLLLVAALLYRLRRPRPARIVLCSALALLLLFSLPATMHWVVQPLEHQYPMYRNQPVEFVIVLGGAHRSDDDMPISSLLSSVSMVRLSEGIRIHRLNPGSKLLLSGHRGRDPLSQAEAMARVAEAYGVARADIVTEPRAMDTDDEAMYWSQVVKDRPHALVTSASHIPRAMSLFHHYGVKPVAAPTEYMTANSFDPRWQDFVPTAWALVNVERAWHEYVGMVWSHINEP